jgi:hypothetical protein
MSRIKVAVGTFAVAALMLALVPKDADAVPAFARQTGLTCNQCHVGVTPFPDFTFTGVRFRMLGYRFPVVAATMEADQEGGINGNRLFLPLHNFTSLHLRERLIGSSKAPSLQSGPASDFGDLTMDPISSIGWYFVGPISDHFGIWNEFYTYDGANQQKQHGGFWSLAEWDVKFAKVVGENNIVGISLNDNQSLGAVFGFGPFHAGFSGALRMFNSYVAGTGASRAHMKLHAYGMFDDRVAVGLGLSPGEDNNNLSDGRLWYGLLGFAPMNTDWGWLWVFGEFAAGDDAVPMVTTMRWDWNTNAAQHPNGPGYTYFSTVGGLDATRSGSAAGTPYRAADIGDILRAKIEARYGFVDRGSHSLTTAVGVGLERETFSDNAEWSRTTLGNTTRYYFNRTYGVHFAVAKNIGTTEFKDAGGLVHTVPDDISWSVNFIYDMAQNVDIFLSLSNSQRSALDTEYRPGFNWSLQFHWLI